MVPESCERQSVLGAEQIVACLHLTGVISADHLKAAALDIAAARSVADSLQATGSYEDLLRGRFVLRALQHLADIHDQGGVRDSARLNRLLDHVAVSAEFVTGQLIQTPEGYWRTNRTPLILWVYLPNVGIFPDLVGSVTTVLGGGPANLDASVPTLEPLGDALWDQAVPLLADGDFPTWDLHYPAFGCSILLTPPRQSAAVQAVALRLFTELLRRTRSQHWAHRAEQVLESLRRAWAEGGVRVVHRKGAWWEEADPRAGYWRTAAMLTIVVWDLGMRTGNPATEDLAREGLLAVRHAVAEFDDGVWTRDCLAGGYQDRDNHRLYIALAEALHQRTGDTFWEDIARRWQALEPPPGFTVAPGSR